MEKIYRLGDGHIPDPSLVAGNDSGRPLGCHYFARACFLSAAADRIQGPRFVLIKFRTMKVNADTHIHETYLEHLITSNRPMIKLDAAGDPRLILGGKFLRASGLDELPQIFNVLGGEMSLVGPRPCTVGEFECYALEQRARVNALPGLTGLWQVNGKNRATFREMIEMDIFYSHNICLSLDLKIILRTLPAIIGQFFDFMRPLPRFGAQPTSSVKT